MSKFYILIVLIGAIIAAVALHVEFYSFALFQSLAVICCALDGACMSFKE